MSDSKTLPPFTFEILHRAEGSAARVGRYSTPHGIIKTPVFMPVGTKATVKTLSSREVRDLGAQIILANTFHLELRPGSERIERFGGLHNFMRWDGPILTDSGGFQVFSLSKLRRVDDDGVMFQSPIDGSPYHFTPKSVMEIQRRLGADIVMAFDECVEAEADRTRSRDSMERTLTWLERCRQVSLKEHQTLFPITQGGHFTDLRQESTRRTLEVSDDWKGVAIGGLSVGESREVMHEMLEASVSEIPEKFPRYLMGVGTPSDLLESVDRGVDLFDCVYPTRTARSGRIFTQEGHIHIKNSCFREDQRPIDESCDCETCQSGYTRAYLHHLYHAKEVLGIRLNTIHNVRFLIRLMEEIQQAIETNVWSDFKRRKRALIQ